MCFLNVEHTNNSQLTFSYGCCVFAEFNDSTRSVQRKERVAADEKVAASAVAALAAVVASHSPSSTTSSPPVKLPPSKKQSLLLDDTVAIKNDGDKEDDTTTDSWKEVRRRRPTSNKLQRASRKSQSQRRLISQSTRRGSLVPGQQGCGATTPAVPMTSGQAFHGRSSRDLVCNHDHADDNVKKDDEQAEGHQAFYYRLSRGTHKLYHDDSNKGGNDNSIAIYIHEKNLHL
jgi:hypothetical protein